MNESTLTIDLNLTDPMTIGKNNNNNNMTDMFNTTEHWYLYLGPYLLDFRYEYIKIHGWISIAVCLFGIIANILNIIVLTRFVEYKNN